MTLRPPLPPHSPGALDAEERALAKSLPRLHGRTAPAPDLDANILAAAQAAVRSAPPSKFAARPRIRWIAPASLAASLVLAVGIAWQLRPLPTLELAQPVADSDSADRVAVQAIEPGPYETPTPNVASKQSQVPSAPAAHPLADNATTSAPEITPPLKGLGQPTPTPPPPAPPAPAAVSARADASQPVGSTHKAAPTSAGNTVDTQMVDRDLRVRQRETTSAAGASGDVMARDAAPTRAERPARLESIQQTSPKAVAPAPVMPEVRNQARKEASADFVDAPEESVPPATVDSPAVRDAWLLRIAELLEQGQQQEAKASLAEFKRRYPAAVLPANLRALEIEP